MKTVKAWHWVKDDWTLRDGQKLEVGKTYTVEDNLVMCERGLHASRKILDALQYAPGSICCRVTCWKIEQEDNDKLVCHKRRVEWAIDATNILHEFACQVAEKALKAAIVTDKRCWAAIEAKRKWLRGEINKDDLDAAWDAARAAARAAARDAAWAAASAAAWAAARDATWAASRAAARDAARDATWAASRAAARAAARDEYNQMLENMIIESRR